MRGGMLRRLLELLAAAHRLPLPVRHRHIVPPLRETTPAIFLARRDR